MPGRARDAAAAARAVIPAPRRHECHQSRPSARCSSWPAPRSAGSAARPARRPKAGPPRERARPGALRWPHRERGCAADALPPAGSAVARRRLWDDAALPARPVKEVALQTPYRPPGALWRAAGCGTPHQASLAWRSRPALICCRAESDCCKRELERGEGSLPVPATRRLRRGWRAAHRCRQGSIEEILFMEEIFLRKRSI
jgi:hypothetical protein